MESSGNNRDLDSKIVNQGIAVFGNKGSTDQHSYFQQLRDVVLNFYATFIEVFTDRAGKSMFIKPEVMSGDYLEGFLLGTRRALHKNGREFITITIKSVSPFPVGLLFAFFEHALGIYGSLININAYHQPGLKAGQKSAAVIDLHPSVPNYLYENPAT